MTGIIEVETFLAVDIRAGVVTRAEAFPEARVPAIKLWVDFGAGIGEKQSSAQITRRYTPEKLVGTTVLAVVNFPPRRIAGFRSEVLVLGIQDPEDAGDIILVRPDAMPGPDIRGLDTRVRPDRAGDGDVRGWRLA